MLFGFNLALSPVVLSIRSSCLYIFVSLAMIGTQAEANQTLKDTVLQHLEMQKSQRCDYRNFVKTRPKPVRTVDLTNQNKQMFKNSEQYAAYMHANATRYFFGGDKAAGKRSYRPCGGVGQCFCAPKCKVAIQKR
jgi:hypothetical protein